MVVKIWKKKVHFKMQNSRPPKDIERTKREEERY